MTYMENAVNIRLTPCPFRKNSILQKNLA